MLEDRVTHHVLLAVAAILFGGGMVLLTAGLFAAYCLEEKTQMPMGLSGFGGLAIIGGLWVVGYVKRRMCT